MPLRNDLLNPVSADKPAGESLRYAPVYDKIKEARRQDDDAPQGEWKTERKVADWPLAVKLISEALATKSKDLQLTAWLAEAMIYREGVNGLREVLDLIRGYLENFWEGLYPELDDGDAEYRAAPLQWVGDRLEAPLKRAPLTRGGLNWFQYKESRAIGTEEAADTSDKQQARLDAIREGKIPQEDFDKDFASTPKKYYVSLLESYDAALESVSALGQVCDEKFGNVAPTFGTLNRALEEIRQTVYILLQAKREIEPDEPVAAPQAELEPEPEPEAASVYAAPSSTGAAPAPARRASAALAAEPADRDDAIGRVVVAARYLRQQDPYSPAPYLMLRGLRWGELRAAGETLDETLLAPPASESRQALKRLGLEANWTELLDTAEGVMGTECGRGWLDLQRYAVRACQEMGSYYDPIRNAITSGLRALLADYPKLPHLTMMDDTPTANTETQVWLKEAVFSGTHGGPAYTAPAYESDAPDAAAAPGAPPDAFELALQAAQSGRVHEGMELLMRAMGQERSSRARFHRKVQLAQLCVSCGHDAVAYPMLQELAAEIDRRKLEDWEASDLIAQPLALLYRCLVKSDDNAAEKQRLYSWICRLDPLQAMSITR